MKKEAIKYNAIILSFIVFVIFGIISFTSKLIIICLNKPIYVEVLNGLLQDIYNLYLFCGNIALLNILVLILIIGKWIFLDENPFKIESFAKTWQLRRYIKRSSDLEFNKTLKYDFVSKTDNKIICFIKIPTNQIEAEKLNRSLNGITDHITYMNSDFTFSRFERNKNYYVLTGTIIR